MRMKITGPTVLFFYKPTFKRRRRRVSKIVSNSYVIFLESQEMHQAWILYDTLIWLLNRYSKYHH